MDKILIHGLVALGILGVYEWERITPREILIDLDIYTDISRAAKTDDLGDCVNYDTLASEVIAFAEKANRHTVEALAEDVAQLCLNKPGVLGVRVVLGKPGAISTARYIGIEIERWRK